MSISFVEFKKLLNPVIPEKFKLIYEILYYYKIDVEELLSLTTDRVILEKNMNGSIQGFMLSNGRFVDLSDMIFERIKNLLEVSKKPWGSLDSKITNNTLNYVFESNKRGYQYTIPTLYKKFKEHCIKVGILRDLALGSLINSDLGRIISIINSKLQGSNEKIKITMFSFEFEELNAILRYYIVHLNYEEIIEYKKEELDEYRKELFLYPHIEITIFNLQKKVKILPFKEDINLSDAILIYGAPASDNSMEELISEVLNSSKNKIISYVTDGDNYTIPDYSEIFKTNDNDIMVNRNLVLQFVPLKSSEMKSKGISLLTSVEELFNSIADRLDDFAVIQFQNEL